MLIFSVILGMDGLQGVLKIKGEKDNLKNLEQEHGLSSTKDYTVSSTLW